MPATFDVAPDALTVARADVDRGHAALAAVLGDVTAEVTALVGASWRGTAATAFGEGHQEWRRGAERVLAALSGAGRALDATRGAYAASDTGASDAFARFDARLGGGPA